MKALPLSAVVLVAASLSMAAAMVVRVRLLEVPVIGWRCAEADAPAWCSAYAAFGWLLGSQAIGAIALALAVLALFASSRALVAAVAAAGAAALVLYNAELGAAALLVAALRSTRL